MGTRGHRAGAGVDVLKAAAFGAPLCTGGLRMPGALWARVKAQAGQPPAAGWSASNRITTRWRRSSGAIPLATRSSRRSRAVHLNVSSSLVLAAAPQHGPRATEPQLAAPSEPAIVEHHPTRHERLPPPWPPARAARPPLPHVHHSRTSTGANDHWPAAPRDGRPRPAGEALCLLHEGRVTAVQCPLPRHISPPILRPPPLPHRHPSLSAKQPAQPRRKRVATLGVGVWQTGCPPSSRAHPRLLLSHKHLAVLAHLSTRRSVGPGQGHVASEEVHDKHVAGSNTGGG